MIIALTGNVASGKSTAAKVFEEAGFLHINADEVGHNLYEDQTVKEHISSLFSKDILTNNKIDRRKLKDIVFNNQEELKKLNAYMHPLILDEIKKQIKKEENYCIEGALLIEANYKDYDSLVLITTSKELQEKRLEERNKYTKEEIQTIIKSQMPQEEKINCADYIVDNSGEIKEFIKDIKSLISKIT